LRFHFNDEATNQKKKKKNQNKLRLKKCGGVGEGRKDEFARVDKRL
jgi:hypothetical protein